MRGEVFVVTGSRTRTRGAVAYLRGMGGVNNDCGGGSLNPYQLRLLHLHNTHLTKNLENTAHKSFAL